VARLWRAHHAPLPHVPGATVELEPAEAHHVARVLRLGAGASLAVFDGAGREWLATIESSEGGRVRVRLQAELVAPVEPPLEVSLFQSLDRTDRLEWVIQKATEIGVAAVYVLATARSRRQARAEKLSGRWRRIAVEAAKQCGRRRVPSVELRPELPDPGPGTVALVADPDPHAPPLAALCAGPPPARVWIAVGPEGGFSADEVAGWGRRGWLAVRLGPRLLRADTAGAVAAAIVLHRWADLGSGR
jgi:16S rRNA (uracil1498-N3)-methyltransferase